MTSIERDGSSPENVVAAVYAVLSGRASEERDWERFRSLCAPEARFMCARYGDGHGAELEMEVLDIEGYVRTRTEILASADFYERELGRRVERFEDVAHVWSAYEARHAPAGEVALRGVNSIQLVRRAGRWWIISAFWQRFRHGAVVPEDSLLRQGMQMPRLRSE